MTVDLKSHLTSARMSAVLAGLVALLLLAGCGSDDKRDATNKVAQPPKLSGTVDLIAGRNGFNKKTAEAKPGTIKITVTVPSSAKGKHGVGIDGGQYKNIQGAPVEPGRSTSLTVAVKKGSYTIFDSFGKNRDKGFTTKLTVK